MKKGGSETAHIHTFSNGCAMKEWRNRVMLKGLAMLRDVFRMRGAPKHIHCTGDRSNGEGEIDSARVTGDS